jgi:ATP-binding cassette, subfamily B, bacterial
MSLFANPLARLWKLVKLEKSEISAIYFYAILSALIQLSLPVGVQAIIGFVPGGAITSSLILLIALVVVAVLAAGLMQISQMKLIEKIQQKIFVRYSFDIAERLPRVDMQKADGYYLPELVNRFFDTATLQKGLSKLLLDIPVASIQILSGLFLLSFYHPAFILFGVLMLFLLLLMLYYTGNKGLQSSIEESNWKYSVAAWLQETARMINSFKFSGGSQIHLRKTDENVTGYLSARTSHFKILMLQFRVLVGFKVIITAALLIVGTVLLVDQQLNIGQFIAAEIVIITVINSVEKLIGNLDSVYDVLTSVEKLGKVTDSPVEKEGSLKIPYANRGLSLEMKQVSFSYNDDFPVLKDISFVVKPGEKVCITGKNGTGKSTLLRLFTGIYTGFTGAVLIEDVPAGNYQLQSLRSLTGILPGRQHIFYGTLWENISMGNDYIDIEKVKQLSEQLGLARFINTLPKGFDTILDPAGKRLPVSVVQKILLVRALASEPRLLLLEDPWEGMEAEYKQQVQDILLNGLPHTTVLTASNDEAFISRCNRVITLNEGAVVN